MGIFELPVVQHRQHCGPLSIREIVFEEGQVLLAHRHNFDHVTFVVTGAVRVRFFNGVLPPTVAVYNAPQFFNVPANVGHEIMAEGGPAVVRCVFPIRDADGRIPEKVTDEDRQGRFYDNREGQGEHS